MIGVADHLLDGSVALVVTEAPLPALAPPVPAADVEPPPVAGTNWFNAGSLPLRTCSGAAIKPDAICSPVTSISVRENGWNFVFSLWEKKKHGRMNTGKYTTLHQ